MDREIDKRNGKTASTLGGLAARMWPHPKLSVRAKMVVCNARVTGSLLYCSDAWTALGRAGEKVQHIPPEKHPPYPGNMLAG